MQILLKATGTEFIFGKVFAPSLGDCTAVLTILHNQGDLEPLMPPSTDVGTVLGLDYFGVKRVLPKIIGNMGLHYDMYQSEWVWPELSESHQFLVWVLLCYNYRVNYGIRPAVPGVKITTKVRTRVDRFICPFCGKNLNINPSDLDSVRAREYLVRLGGHFISYHKWFSITKLVNGYQKHVQEAVNNYISTMKLKEKEEKANQKAKETRSTKLVKHQKALSKQVPNRDIRKEK